ncbi:hypothetical protein PAXRUDRAFT_194983, partial [Paxillus rubicundulus Ve08.2h10]
RFQANFAVCTSVLVYVFGCICFCVSLISAAFYPLSPLTLTVHPQTSHRLRHIAQRPAWIKPPIVVHPTFGTSFTVESSTCVALPWAIYHPS